MALFGSERGDLPPSSAPRDPEWVKEADGHFPKFLSLDPEREGLPGVSGIYVIWHGGVRPAWVHIGKSNDLAASFHLLAENEDITDYERNGGLFVTWSLVRKEHQDGVLCYLDETMETLVPNTSINCKDITLIPVIAPGVPFDKG
jgi:hypothetical protein